jgi:hypothetical protein
MKTSYLVKFHVGLLTAAGLSSDDRLIAASPPAPVNQEWATRIDGPTNSIFQLGGISIGPSGDAFVAGSARRFGWNHDIVISRYNASGALVWQKDYQPEEDSSANEVALGLVAHGTNAYVTGTTTGTNGVQRFLTLKYRDNGDLEWARYYGGPGHTDRATTLAVDGLGNTIVAGESIGTHGSLDVLVVKYAPNGDLLWTYSFDAPGHFWDRVAGLKLDDAGNVHIAGTSTGADSGPSIFTLKVSAGGQELWVAREESNLSTGLNASGLDLDSAGNVATVGGERFYHVTWKYDANGNRQWVARYRTEEPASLYAVDVRFDQSGNIIAGASLHGGFSSAAVLIKYDPGGQKLWAARIADPNGPVYLQGMDVDGAGNSYLIGSPVSDVVTFKVGPDGEQLWSTAYNSSGLFTDYGQFLDVTPSGDFFVGVRSYYYSESFVSLVKYTSQTQPEFVTAVVTPALQVVDPGTNVIFTAEITGTGPVHFQWRKNGRAIPGATSASLELTDVQAEHRGDYSVVISNSIGTTVSPEARLSVRTPPEVVVTPEDSVAYPGTDAAFMASVSGNDFVTLQWRHNGTNVPGATNEIFQLADLHLTDSGLYDVVASTFGGTTTSSAAGLRISRAVELIQVTAHRGALSTWEYAPQFKVFPNGESLIASRSNQLQGSAIVLSRYASNGTPLWSTTFESTEFTNSEPARLGLDAAGNVYLTGISRRPYLGAALAVLKFSGTGALLWSRILEGTNLWGSVHSLAVDPDGNSTIGTLGGQGVQVIRYNGAGDKQWSFDDPSPDTDTIAVAADSGGNSYLGTTIRVGGYNEIRLRKFDSGGTTVWTRPYGEGMHHRLGQIAVDSGGNLIVAGTGTLPDVPDSSMFVAKYSPAGLKVWETRTGSSWSEIAYLAALAVGPGDEITVLTESDDDYEPGERSGVTRIGPDGRLRYRIAEPQILVSSPSQLALDGFGNAYLTGYGGRPVTGADTVTAKYDAYGNRHWLVYHGGENMSWQSGLAVGVDTTGDIRVLSTGGSDPDGNADFQVLHYRQRDPAGTFRLQLVPDPAGTFHLQTPTAEPFQIESSTDLQNWNALNASETQQLLQPGGTAFSSSIQRFFRLILAE